MRKKQHRTWGDIEHVLDDIGNALDAALPLTPKTNRMALALAREHGIAFYDAPILAAALEAGCDTPITEDMQHGRKFGSLSIVNPFLGSPPSARGAWSPNVSVLRSGRSASEFASPPHQPASQRK